VPSKYLSLNIDPSNHLFRAGSASTLFGYGCPNPQSASLGRWRLHFVRVRADAFLNLSFGLSTLLIQHAQILVAIYQFGCRMSNTKVSPRFATSDGPVFISNALCREIFHTYGMKFAPMDASGASQRTGLRPGKSNAARVGVAPAHVDSSRGTRI
jgi:hypothetical protein